RVFAVDKDAAGGIEGGVVLVESGGAIEAAEEVEERAFSRAAGADDGDVFLRVNFQVDAFEDVVDGIAGAEEFVEILGAEEGVGWDGRFFSARGRDCKCHGGSFR